jgi:hypothetical protein
MKHLTPLVSILALATVTACGGSKKPAPPPPQAAAPAPAPEPAPAPAPPPPPPEPKIAKAKADMTPSKGAKFKPATITFSEPEGGPTAIASTGWFDGLKAGTYHLVVHDGTDCAKPGPIFKAAAAADMSFPAAKDSSNVDIGGVTVELAGDSGIGGHVLVMTDDKKGKPGKTVACGAIVALDQTE